MPGDVFSIRSLKSNESQEDQASNNSITFRTPAVALDHFTPISLSLERGRAAAEPHNVRYKSQCLRDERALARVRTSIPPPDVVLRDSLAIKHLLVELVDEGPAWCDLRCICSILINSHTATNVLNDSTMSNTKTANNVAVIEAGGRQPNPIPIASNAAEQAYNSATIIRHVCTTKPSPLKINP